MGNDMKQLIVILLALILISACKSQNLREVQGQPAEYQAGYHHGCDSGYVAAGHPYYSFTKDVARFEHKDQYRQGWTDGFNVCKSQYESITHRR